MVTPVKKSKKGKDSQVSVEWLRGKISKYTESKFHAFAQAWKYETGSDIVPCLSKNLVSCILKSGKKIVGIAQFTSPPDIIGKELAMVWIDPRFRRMGVLKRAYEIFLAEVGKFYLSSPISRNMAKFLLKNMPEWQDKLHGKSLRENLPRLASEKNDSHGKTFLDSEDLHIAVSKASLGRKDSEWLHVAVDARRLPWKDAKLKIPQCSMRKLIAKGHALKPWSPLGVRYGSWEDSLALEGTFRVFCSPRKLIRYYGARIPS
jgi:hypothetical protein